MQLPCQSESGTKVIVRFRRRRAGLKKLADFGHVGHKVAL